MSDDKQRRPLSHQGGPIETFGDVETRDMLARAFERAAGEEFDSLTHGFHSYPARMHPAIARSLLESLARPGAGLLDPFCGGGTVVIEGLRAGLSSVGLDLSPLAVRLARVKCMRRGPRERAAFLEDLRGVARRSEERVRNRVEVRAPLSKEERAYYASHTLKELAGIREELLVVEDATNREALLFLLSAIVVKFSKQAADTAGHVEDRRIRKGLPTEFFVRKGEELAERWGALFAATAKDTRRPFIAEANVLDLPGSLPGRFRPDLILTSPPYGGTYDYVRHHARRYPWLGLEPERLSRGELGARRKMHGPDARARWDQEFGQILDAMRRAIAPKGGIILLLGDAQVGGERIAAEEQLLYLAPRVGLQVVAAAAERRPDFTGGEPRREHLFLLEART